VFPVRYKLNSYIYCILPTQSVYVFRMILTINSINRLGSVAETSCVSCEVQTEFFYILNSARTVYLVRCELEFQIVLRCVRLVGTRARVS
jgi:hypothetical protein